MMATEVTSDKLEDVSTIAVDHQPLTEPATNQDASYNTPLLNGHVELDDDKPYTDSADLNVNSAEVSVSGGSDTEAARAEASKSHTDEKGHLRTGSAVRKLASFKPVSVNKKFLAMKSAVPSTPSKLGEKTGAAAAGTGGSGTMGMSAPRPRLVAKSVNGLRDSAPRSSSAGSGGIASAAPDPGAVWNKNRPAPPPEPKHFTDEELTRTYGIHLATRLQPEDASKQANWADIDDDDDDWAPETIEWTDGTKITLPQAEELVAEVPEPIPAPIVEEAKVTEIIKPKSPPPATSSPKVRLGGISGSGKGLVLKGAPEKPTLVAKPAGPPTPVKSPWAALPPVDKTASISLEVQPPPQQMPRFHQRDPHGFESMPPIPAKEIAADDFSRSWREGNANTSRELYNSQSGRYEPVNDSRRGSSRGEGQSRQPSLLQRPSHHDSQGPAEPSSAFQTHRSVGHDGVYGRRRTSSNVSGGSGHLARRMSRGGQDGIASHDLLNARRGSLAAVSDTPSSPQNVSPSAQYPAQKSHPGQAWPQGMSPAISHASPASVNSHVALPPGDARAAPPPPYHPQAATPSARLEDDLELQKKVMREKRELARKRRLEEEAKEEAAKKERIRLKLIAMGPAPESKKSKAENISKDNKAIPTQIQGREETLASTSAPLMAEQDNTIAQSLPEATPTKGVGIAVASPDAKATESKAVPEESLANGVHPAASHEDPVQSRPGNENTPQDINKASWQSPPSSERYSSWGSAGHATPGRSVWGPPSSDKTLGNGTFNPELSRLPELQATQPPPPPGPGPIGPPNASRGNQYQRRNHEQYAARPGPIGPPHRPEQSQRPPVARTSEWQARILQDDAARRAEVERQDSLRPETKTVTYRETYRPITIAEDGSRQSQPRVHRTINHTVTNSDNPVVKEQEGESSVSDMPAPRQDAPRQDAPRRELQDSRTSAGIENGVRNDAIGSLMLSASKPGATSSPPFKQSKFFPAKDVRLEDPNSPLRKSRSTSPPPPTMAGHPVYDGDMDRPHVSLPRPSPVVRLPPAQVLAPIGPPKAVISFAAAAATPPQPQTPTAAPITPTGNRPGTATRPRTTPQEPTRQPHGQTSVPWQDRINSLMARMPSPPKTAALAVDSASKSALDIPPQQPSATVSFPSSAADSVTYDEEPTVSKSMAEECFEEQEMGSLPAVNVPVKAPEAAWHLAPSQHKPMPRKFVLTQSTSAEPYTFFQQAINNSDIVSIKFPGMSETKTVSVPRRMDPHPKPNMRKNSHPRGGAPRHASTGHPRGGRQREGMSGYPSPKLDQASMSSGPNVSGRGGPRGRGGFNSSWSSRHVSTPAAAV